MKTAIWITLICTAFLIAGCTPYVIIKFFNHTGVDITVQGNNQQIAILKNSTGELIYHSLTPNFPLSVTLDDLTRGEVIKMYNITPFPDSYVKPSVGGLKGYEIFFQIEPNGFIYVLPPESSMPVQKLEPQPSGYPLKSH